MAKKWVKDLKKNWKVLAVCLLIVYAVAAIGSIITTNKANIDWYASAKTPLTPPNYVFMIVWNILFFLIALSLYFVWIKSNKKQRKKLALVYGINLALNSIWSILFFSLKNPNLAFLDLALLWVSIVSMILVAGRIEKKSSWLLSPYLLWVGFAGVLNYMIAFGY